jgi:hypothetical protein
MQQPQANVRVYREFFTNGAVAWFSASVIPILFTKFLDFHTLFTSIMAFFFCMLFLYSATIFNPKQ